MLTSGNDMLQLEEGKGINTRLVYPSTPLKFNKDTQLVRGDCSCSFLVATTTAHLRICIIKQIEKTLASWWLNHPFEKILVIMGISPK